MSCDNIGSFVQPHFTPEFKEDPYHIPGYQGFVPQFKYRSEGKTFSNATKNLFENPCIASSGKLILADINRQDPASIVKPGFECKVWEDETRKCREIQARCLPGCYDKPPAQYPQPYLNSLQPANVYYKEYRQLPPSQPEVCRGVAENSCAESSKRGGSYYNTDDLGLILPSLDATSTTPSSKLRRPKESVKVKGTTQASVNRDAVLRKQLQQQFLICPSQTVYDPRTNARYFMFSQQNSRDCGKIAPRPVIPGNCVSMSSCKEICPCPQTQLKIRQLYPECGGMMSGYGGHVPGLNDCTLGDNYKKATAKVLKQVVGGKREYPGPWSLKLPDCSKRQRSNCGRGV